MHGGGNVSSAKRSFARNAKACGPPFVTCGANDLRSDQIAIVHRRSAMAHTADANGPRGGKRRKGRPPGAKLTDEQKRQIVSFVEAGGSVDAAVQAAGISLRTFRETVLRARGVWR